MLQKFIFFNLFFVSFLLADSITIFAASDLKFALDSIKTNFLKNNPNDTINMIYGSSGKGRVQVNNNAPFDLYFSANMDYVQELYKANKLATQPKLYAIGRLVIWSKNPAFVAKNGFKNFEKKWVDKISIANPSHAPYGEKAKQALQSMKMYKSLKRKIVLGENISQTANYINIEATDIGIIALSLVLAPKIASSHYASYYLIDDKLHKPLRQGYAITKYAENSLLAHQFYDFFQTKNSVQILNKYGFVVHK